MPVFGDFSDKPLNDFFVSAGFIDSHLQALVLEAREPMCYVLEVTSTLQSKASPRSRAVGFILYCFADGALPFLDERRHLVP
jgi:hypothetical protein